MYALRGEDLAPETSTGSVSQPTSSCVHDGFRVQTGKRNIDGNWLVEQQGIELLTFQPCWCRRGF